MQQLVLRRFSRSNQATVGKLYLDGVFLAYTLENPWLDNEPFISCIPLGEYKVIKDDTGKFRYWKLLNVEGRSGIEIHNGNIEKHTQGCILIGCKFIIKNDEPFITNSKNTLNKLRSILDDNFLLKITL